MRARKSTHSSLSSSILFAASWNPKIPPKGQDAALRLYGIGTCYVTGIIRLVSSKKKAGALFRSELRTGRTLTQSMFYRCAYPGTRNHFRMNGTVSGVAVAPKTSQRIDGRDARPKTRANSDRIMDRSLRSFRISRDREDSVI
jgi:hypothetical protein